MKYKITKNAFYKIKQTKAHNNKREIAVIRFC